MKLGWGRLIVGLVVIAVVVGLVIWSRSSSTGVVTSKPHKTADSLALGKTLNGKHFRLVHQNHYAVRILPAKDNDIELYTLRANTVYDKRLAVLITKLPSGVLTDDGSYNYRKVHPQDYQERLLPSAAGEAHIMMKTDNKEQTVFISHNGMLATLAFVTDGAADQLSAEVDQVVTRFRWKS